MTKPQSYWNDMNAKYGHLGDRVVCRVCGKTFQFLGAHIRVHNLDEFSYKDKFAILHNLPLCADDLSDQLRESTIKRMDDGTLWKDGQLDKFTSSKRMSGKSVPPAAKSKTGQRYRGKKLSDETICKISEFAKNRPGDINKNIGRSVSKFYRNKFPERECKNCHNGYSAPSKKRITFCSRKCQNEFAKKEKMLWVGKKQTSEKSKKMLEAWKSGKSYLEIAKEFGCTKSNVWAIITRLTLRESDSGTPLENGHPSV